MISIKNSSGTIGEFSDNGDLSRFESNGISWETTPALGWFLIFRVDEKTQKAYGQNPSVKQVENEELVVECPSVQLDDGSRIDVDVSARWKLNGELLQMQLSMGKIPEGHFLESIGILDINVAYKEKTQLVIPVDTGLLLDDAAKVLFENENAPGKHTIYPQIQLLGWIEGDRGLYMDCRDPEGWMKHFELRSPKAKHVRIYFEHKIGLESENIKDFGLTYPVSLGAFSGGWFSCAEIYRKWALKQHWAQFTSEKRKETPIADLACWVWNRGRSDDLLPAVKEFSKRLGLPIALDWYWWHKQAYDIGFPDYFPPREGEKSFRNAIKSLRDDGVFVQAYTNGMSWDMTLPSWSPDGENCCLRDINGKSFSHTYNIWNDRPLAHTCGASKVWHEKILEVSQTLIDYGMKSLYLDQIAFSGGKHLCYNEDHGHKRGAGNYGVKGFRELLKKTRELKPGTMVTSESVSENYNDLLDATITLYTSFERFSKNALKAALHPIPLASAIYHGHVLYFGNYSSLDGIPPYDDLWPDEGRIDSSQEKDWTSICPDQFAFEMARTIAFGVQPMICNLSMEHFENPKFKEDLDFLMDCSRFFHENRETLLWGKMLSPGKLVSEGAEIKFFARSVYTRPKDFDFFKRESPLILHSEWQSADGKCVAVLVNFSRKDAEFSYAPPSGFQLKNSSDKCITGKIATRQVLKIPLSKPTGL